MVNRWSLSSCFVVVQNWKLRWFVLNKNEIRYYARRTSPEPIRTMDLRECQECIKCMDDEQDYSFSYVVVTVQHHNAFIVLLYCKHHISVYMHFGGYFETAVNSSEEKQCDI